MNRLYNPTSEYNRELDEISEYFKEMDDVEDEGRRSGQDLF